MWKRYALFVLLCLTGLGSLFGMLLRRERIVTPRDFQPQRLTSPSYADVIAGVNAEFQAHWREKQVEPAPPADSLTLARRLSLALTGTIPSVEEIKAFEALPPAEQLEWWLSRLLEDRRSSDYLAERLARAYVGTDQGPFLLFRRRRFVTWLSDQLHANRPYDELVRELITAKGLWTDAPAVNFLTATAGANEKDQPDDIKLAGRTARAFLGTRIDCLQCHDDKLAMVELGTASEPREGLQSDFHQLAAFFCEARLSPLGINDFQAEYRYKYLDQDAEVVVEPQPPFLPDLMKPAVTRRQQLADWVTHPENRPFSRAMVNRMWALLFGKPLVEPIDNVPLHGPFPPAMEALAQDFTDHGFDLQRLIRVIAATEPFQRSSRADFEVTARHENAWAVFPVSRLRPEQVAGSIVQAASLTTLDANSHVLAQLIQFFQESGFVQRYGDIGEDEFSEQPSTITQRLLMMNGELVRERTNENPLTNAVTRIDMLAPHDERAIELTYLAVLTRRPTPPELRHFLAAMQPGDSASDPPPNRRRALEDLYWVLLNGTEFSWNH